MRLSLQKLNKSAAESTSQSMKKLFQKDVRLKIARACVVPIKKLKPLLPAEEMIAGVCLTITGDIKGTFFLAIPREDAFALSNMLLAHEQGPTRKLSRLDKSVIKEVGNILCAQYLTILSNKLGIRIVEHVPSFKYDMFGSISSELAMEFASHINSEALVAVVHMDFGPAAPKAYVMLFVEPLPLTRLLK